MRKLFFALLAVLGIASFSLSITVKAADNTNKFGVKIDGNFDDWKDKPKTDIQNPWDSDPIKQMSLLTDGKYIYFYVTMSKSGKDNYPMQVNDYQLTIGNVMYKLQIKDFNHPNNNAGNFPANGNKRVMLVSESDGDRPLVKSPAIVHRFVKNGKEYAAMEAKIPFTDLRVQPTDAQKISMKAPILGGQSVTAEGGGTGPFVLIAIGFVIALLGVIGIPIYKKRKKIAKI